MLRELGHERAGACGVRGVLGGLPGVLVDARDVLADLAGGGRRLRYAGAHRLRPLAACTRFREISWVVMLCSSTAEAIVREASFTRVTTSAMRLIAVMAWPDEALDAFHPLADIVGGLGGLAGELFDLGGHHGKAFPGVAGAGRLDRGVQRQELGLPGNVLDDLDDLADAVGRLAQAADLLVRVLHELGGLVGDLGGLLGMRATSLMAAVISSTLVATRLTFCDICVEEAAMVVMLTDISSAAAATVLDCWVVCSAPWVSVSAVCDNCPAARPRSFEHEVMSFIIATRRSVMILANSRSSPISSCDSKGRRCVKSPSAILRKAATVARKGLVIERITTRKNSSPPRTRNPLTTPPPIKRVRAVWASASSSDLTISKAPWTSPSRQPSIFAPVGSLPSALPHSSCDCDGEPWQSRQSGVRRMGRK